MRWLTLPLVVVVSASAPDARPPLDSLAHYYATRQPRAIARLLAGAATREDQLLCRYRLYPLTRDRALVSQIPPAADARTAREAALIAAMWAFRIHSSPPWSMPTYGRRVQTALDRARALDASDPYYLLVDGQSLLYRPAVFGGSPSRALDRFRRLRAALAARPAAGIHPVEAEVWIWMAMRRLGDPDADAFRRRLLAGRPPPLFRQFLLDPPP
jgi:hypothetical protein